MDTAECQVAAMAEVKRIINKSINIDKLIDLVKDKPVIWDKSVEGYRNKDFSTYAWEEIYRVLFNSYDEWGEQQKIYVGKMVKQKWTTARDVWQRTHKKRKEAMQTGENISELKDSARYEKLKFLTKIYEKYDYFPSNNDEKLVKNLEDIENPPSPPAEPEVDNLQDNANLQNDLRRFFMNKKPEVSFNLPTQKLKTDNGGLANVKLTNEHRTTVVNVEDRVKVGNLIKASKRKSSSNGNMEADKINKLQSSSHAQIKSPRREENSSLPNKQFKPSNYSQNRISANDYKEADKIKKFPSSSYAKTKSPQREENLYLSNKQSKHSNNNNPNRVSINDRTEADTINKMQSLSHIQSMKSPQREENLSLHNKQSKRISTNERTEDDRTINKSPSSSHFQSIKSPKREDISSLPNNQANDSSSSPIYQAKNSPEPSSLNQASNNLQHFKQEDLSKPGVSNHNTTTPCVNATIVETEQSQDIQLKHFIEMLKPRIEDFDKSQMMQFLLEILKPLINDFNKHQLLDFQIEALQLVRKIEGNRTT